MDTIRRKTVLGRGNRLTAGGVLLSALGLVGLFLALAGGWNAGHLVAFLIEAVGGLTLTIIGFMLMVLGADPFSDTEGGFPARPDTDESDREFHQSHDLDDWTSPTPIPTRSARDLKSAATGPDH